MGTAPLKTSRMKVDIPRPLPATLYTLVAPMFPLPNFLTTMPGMKNIIDRINKEGLRDKVKVLIGGAPITQSYADEIGADGYAPDAGSAVDKLKEVLLLA